MNRSVHDEQWRHKSIAFATPPIRYTSGSGLGKTQAVSLTTRWSRPESADAGKIKVRPSARPPPNRGAANAKKSQHIIWLFMILAHTLRLPVKLSLATKSTAFKPNLFLQYAQTKHFFSGVTSKMAQPKYLTGDKAGIDAFVDQFDVSFWELRCFRLKMRSLTCSRCSSSTAMVRMPRLFTTLSDYATEEL
jgi:hypothetical protein